MNIYKKVFLSIFLLFSIFAFILIYVSQGLVLSNFQKLEEKSAEENLIRLKGVLDSETAYMGRINLDWAAWNETYEFIETPSPSYLDLNLPEGTLQDLNLNLILFANETGHVIRAKLEDSEGGEELPLP
ncbi:MAG: CHASE4 domain-containing protein, partial [Methanosarcinaceae archaeon]|nr:CHASE4 domain-containing protein [Methanosarcinaceae archaeon]